MRFVRTVGLYALVVALATTATPALAVSPTYDVVTLPKVGGLVFFPNRGGNPINDAGLVAGSVLQDNRSRPVLYDTARQAAYLLGPTDGRSAFATDVNNRGLVVGNVIDPTDQTVRPFTAGRSRHLRLLVARLPAGSSAGAAAVNDRGVIAGRYSAPNANAGDGDAVIWKPRRHGGYRMVDVSAGLGLSYAGAVGITNRGAVLVSYLNDRNGAVLWQPHGRPALPVLPLPGDDTVLAYGVNDAGTVVGESYNIADPIRSRPFVWHADDQVTRPLAVLDGFLNRPTAVGPTGVVVGQAIDVQTDHAQAVVWSADGATVRPLPGQADAHFYAESYGVNGRGQIVGWTVYRALIWTPRPTT